MGSRLLLIAQPGSYRIVPYLAAAKQMQLEVLIASRGEYSLISEVYDGLHIDFDDLDASLSTILKEAEKRPLIGVLGSDDSTVELAAMVSKALGLPHNPPQAARFSRRKDLARTQLSLSSCVVPKHHLIDLNQTLESQISDLPWPCVLKPLSLSASRGVIRANNVSELVGACKRIKPIIADSADAFEQSHILVEQYIDGFEVAYEGFLYKKRLTTIALFDKPDPLVGPFFEETIYVTPSQLPQKTQAKIKQRVEEACTAYGLTTGPIHAELRVNEKNAWILEVASRTIGGDCGRTLDSGEEFMLEELTISLAIDKPYEIKPAEDSRGVMMIPIEKSGILRRVEGITEAKKIPLIETVDILIREGNKLVPLPEGNQYAGYIFARGDNPTAVTEALRQAYAKLDFVTAPFIALEKSAV